MQRGSAQDFALPQWLPEPGHRAPDAALNVLELLSRRWPLDELLPR
jgi:hypothetical protein